MRPPQGTQTEPGRRTQTGDGRSGEDADASGGPLGARDRHAAGRAGCDHDPGPGSPCSGGGDLLARAVTGQRSERSAGAATATAGLATVASSETLAYLTVLPNVFLNADRAAWYPHIPCTPPPGGVELEQI